MEIKNGREEQWARWVADFDVLEVAPPLFVVRIKVRDIQYSSRWPKQEHLVQEMERIAIRAAYEVELTPSGELKGVRNWTAVRDDVSQTASVLMTELVKGGMSGWQAYRLMQFVKSSVSTHEAIKVLVTRDFGLCFFPLGRELDRIARTRDGQAPNIFGGDAILARQSVQLLDYDPTSRQVRLSVQCGYDSSSLSKSVGQMTDKMLRMIEKPPPASMPGVEVREEGQFVVDRDSGWLVSAEYEQVITSGSDSMRTKATWRRIQPATGPATHPKAR